MLVIRAAQLEELRRLRRAEFEQALESRIALEYPVQAERLGPRLLPVVIRSCMSQAADYGLASFWSLAAFVSLSFAFGPGFHRHTAIRGALTDSSYTAEDRLGRLSLMIPDRVWKEATDLTPSW